MAMTEKEKKEVFDFLNEMLECDEFCDFIEYKTESTWYDFDCSDDADQYTEDDVRFACGATKGVIVNYGLGYALKFPFTEDEDGCHLEDHCKYEWRNYIVAEKAGYGKMFAAIDYVGDYFGMPVYAQEIVDCDEDRVSESTFRHSFEVYCDENGLDPEDEESRDDFYDNYWGDEDEHYEIIACCAEAWGVDAGSFYGFLEDNCINDMHEGNWGFSGDKLVLVDYSGYHPYIGDKEEWFSVLDAA